MNQVTPPSAPVASYDKDKIARFEQLFNAAVQFAEASHLPIVIIEAKMRDLQANFDLIRLRNAGAKL